MEKGFNDTERRGLLGKTINYLDTSQEPEMGFNTTEKKQMLLEYFSTEELKRIYNKMNESEKTSTFEKINPFFTKDKIEKIYDYLSMWKDIYWGSKNDMSNFLSGIIRRKRNRTAKAQKQVLRKIADKTNTDVSKEIEKYLGGKRYNKIQRKSRKTRIQ